MPKIRLKNVRERAREKVAKRPRVAQAVWEPWAPRPEGLSALYPRVAHAPPTGLG